MEESRENRRSRALVPLFTSLAFLASWGALYLLSDDREQLLLRHGELVRRNDQQAGDLGELQERLVLLGTERAQREQEAAALAENARALAIEERRTNAYRLRAAEIALDASRLSQTNELLQAVPEEARGFAWRFLRARSKRRFPRLAETEDDALVLCTAPDQAGIAVGTRSGRLVGYPLPAPGQSGGVTPRFVLETHEEAIFACAFAPSGARIASGNLAGQVSVWDIAGRASLFAFDFEETVTALGFVDETRLAIGGDDGRLVVWNLDTKERTELRGHDRTINAIEVDRERQRFATAGDDAVARIWSGPGFARMVELQGHGDWVRDVAFAPDGRTVATASSDRTIRHWEASSGEELRSSSTNGVEVVGFEYARDGSGFCAFGRFGELLFERSGARLEYDVPLVNGIAVLAGTAAADLSWLALAMGGATSFWRVDPAPDFVERSADMGELRHLAASEDGRLVVAGGADGGVWVFDEEGTRRLGSHRGACMAVSLSANGELCASGGRDGKARVFELGAKPGAKPGEKPGEKPGTERGSERERLVLDVDDKPLVGVALSAEGELLACVSRTGRLRTYDTTSGALVQEIPAPQNGIAAAAMGRQAKLMAWVGDGGTIRTWDVRSGERVHPLRDRDLVRVAAMALSENGLRLACSNNDNLAHVYDLESKERICVVEDPDHSIWSLAIDARGELLATGSRNGVIQLWDVASGERLIRLRGRYEAILSLEFRGDGKALYAGTDEGRLEIFEVELE